MNRGLLERLSDIKDHCEQLVQDLRGNPARALQDRVLGKAALYDLHVIGEACGALPPDLKARHPEVDWKGWADFRNLTTHVYWRADVGIAIEAMRRALPLLIAMVAHELLAAAQAAGLDVDDPQLSWSLAGVGDQPEDDADVDHRPPSPLLLQRLPAGGRPSPRLRPAHRRSSRPPGRPSPTARHPAPASPFSETSGLSLAFDQDYRCSRPPQPASPPAEHSQASALPCRPRRK